MSRWLMTVIATLLIGLPSAFAQSSVSLQNSSQWDAWFRVDDYNTVPSTQLLNNGRVPAGATFTVSATVDQDGNVHIFVTSQTDDNQHCGKQEIKAAPGDLAYFVGPDKAC